MANETTPTFKFTGFEEVTSAVHGNFYSVNLNPASIRVPCRCKVGFFFRCLGKEGAGLTFTSGGTPVTVLLPTISKGFTYYETPFSVDKGSIIHVSASLDSLHILGATDIDYPKPKLVADPIVPLDLGYMFNILAEASGDYTALKARAAAVDYFQDKHYTSLELISSSYGQGIWYKGVKYILHEGRLVLADLDSTIRVELAQRNSLLLCYRNKYSSLTKQSGAIVPVFN